MSRLQTSFRSRITSGTKVNPSIRGEAAKDELIPDGSVLPDLRQGRGQRSGFPPPRELWMKLSADCLLFYNACRIAAGRYGSLVRQCEVDHNFSRLPRYPCSLRSRPRVSRATFLARTLFTLSLSPRLLRKCRRAKLVPVNSSYMAPGEAGSRSELKQGGTQHASGPAAPTDN